MHNRILDYLLRAGGPVTARQVLLEVLNVRAPDPRTADQVLRGLLQNDTRFRHVGPGLWTASESAAPGGASCPAVVLFIRGTDPSIPPVTISGVLFDEDTARAHEFTVGVPSGTLQDESALSDARTQAEGKILVTWDREQAVTWQRLLRRRGLTGWTDRTVHLRQLSRRIFPGIPRAARPEDLAPYLDIPPPDPSDPARMAVFLASCFRELLAKVPPGLAGNWESLEEWTARPPKRINFDRFSFGECFLRSLPEAPGVYLMRNRAGELFYVGKARNLRRRVRSYFTPSALEDRRTAAIHEHLHSIEVCLAPSEVEALILEMRMIRDFRPGLNLQTGVHERPSSYGKTRNLLLLVPDHDRDKTKVYFFKDGRFRGRSTAVMGRGPSAALLRRIRTLFFTRPVKKRGIPPDWETELISSWLTANRRRLNFLDVDEAGSWKSVRRQLESYLKDPELLSSKIIQR